MDVSKLPLMDPMMKKHAARLKTYESWPLSFMDKNEMAAAGFYFTGFGDMVRCPFCKVLMGYWKSGDNPFFDHKRRSPDCDFANGNIPTDSDTPIRCGCGYKY
jgi:hypothetical protein